MSSKPTYSWSSQRFSRGTTVDRDIAGAGLGEGDAGEYVFYNQTVGRLQVWNGASWEAMSGFDE